MAGQIINPGEFAPTPVCVLCGDTRIGGAYGSGPEAFCIDCLVKFDRIRRAMAWELRQAPEAVAE